MASLLRPLSRLVASLHLRRSGRSGACNLKLLDSGSLKTVKRSVHALRLTGESRKSADVQPLTAINIEHLREQASFKCMPRGQRRLPCDGRACAAARARAWLHLEGLGQPVAERRVDAGVGPRCARGGNQAFIGAVEASRQLAGVA